jgi:tetratricopeptide (TPR) repeat protein
LVEREPGNARYHVLLAENWTWVGSSLLDLARLADAEAAYRRALAAAETTANLDPRPTYREEEADELGFLADVLVKQGKPEEAMPLLAQGLEIQRELVAFDPENADWRGDLARSLSRIAELQLLGSHPNEAVGLLEEARQLTLGLAAAAPDSTRNQRALARYELMEARALMGSGQSQQAVAAAIRATETLQATVGETGALSLSTDLAEAGELLGRAWQASGDIEKAEEAWRFAMKALPPGQGSMVQEAIRAQLHALLGENDAAAALARELRNAGFGDPRYPLPGG